MRTFFFLKEKNEYIKLSEAQKAFLYFKKKKLNLLTGQYSHSSQNELQKKLTGVDFKTNQQRPLVIHLFYEYGKLLQEIDVSEDDELAIIIEYKKVQRAEAFHKKKEKGLPNNLKISLDFYKEQFRLVQENLYKGNCYQLNLTHRFSFELLENKTLEDWEKSFLGNSEYLSAYAHASFIPLLKRALVSNSPECLFNYDREKREVYSMPIKGSYKIENSRMKKSLKRKMKKDKKEQAELFMIADMVRNDLARVTNYSSFFVSSKKFLEVTGILHQYSLISGKIEESLSLFDVLCSLFPGASVTGAPKKRVMQLIDQIETSPRGIYCGSTILCMGKNKSASINIRTADINFKTGELLYGSGGGITLESDSERELSELKTKIQSFFTSLPL